MPLNALDVPSIVQEGTSSVCDKCCQFAYPVHTNCHGTLCHWSSDSEGAMALRAQLKPWNK